MYFIRVLVLTASILSATFISYSQCVLSVYTEYADLLTPYTAKPVEYYFESQVPYDLNSKKWKNYRDLELVGSIMGEYSVFSKNGLVGKTKVVSADTFSENGILDVEIKLSDNFEGSDLYAIKSTWNVQPRPIKALSNSNPSYIQAVKDILIEKLELKNSEVVIKSILQTDLDGDQKNEVIIHASNHSVPYTSHVEDYSIIFIRYVINDKMVTTIINFDHGKRPCTSENYLSGCWLSQFEIVGIIDLNGDGTMEILITDLIDHGRGITAYEFTPEGLKAVLNWAIGD